MASQLALLPFLIIFILIIAIIIILAIIFWIWMIVDCAQRKFKNETEKIVWIIVITLASWIGSLIYYFVIKVANPKGISNP
ncbi:MAG: PLDc N-terminal domain-containing protein [Nanoarchaeota archaeon]|nr:PLDc N-terminal domain-containing protein [Nanoarchaeota archaeon]